MKELVVISGKGGTGKTSIVACFAALASENGGAVLADCDVDAADLHLVLEPEVKHREPFSGGREAVIREQDCTGCGECLARCRFDAVKRDEGKAGDAGFSIDPISCEGCGVCVHFCPVGAIDFPEKVNGEWFVSETRHGPMVHAKLGIAEENSGKLVSIVRNKAREVAEERGLDTIIVDGSPGIGCPVIASLSGASQVLVITEPTLSGEHDLGRVLDLAEHFRIPAAVCVNKADLNVEIADGIASGARARGVPTLGRIRYDSTVTAAQVAGRAVVEQNSGPAAEDIRSVWEELCRRME